MKIEDLKIPRKSHCICVLGKYIYIAGGISQNGEILSNVEKYDEETNKWKKVVPMNYSKMTFGLVCVKNTKTSRENMLLTLGGHPKIEQYTRKNNAWKFFEYHNCSSNSAYTTHSLYKNKVYTSGGYFPDDKNSKQVLNRIFEYDPYENSWKGLPKMIKAVYNHSMVEYDNKLFIFGGIDDKFKVVNTVQMFNLETGNWEELQGLKIPRMNHCTVVYKNLICILGGENRLGELEDTVEIYDPVNKIYFSSRKLPFRLTQFASTVYNDKIYITGGVKDDNSFSESVFIYEPLYTEMDKKIVKKSPKKYRKNTIKITRKSVRKSIRKLKV